MARNDKQKDRDYANKWYHNRKDLAKKGEAIDNMISHSHKLTVVGLAMALAMSSAALWLSWKAYDMSQQILGR